MGINVFKNCGKLTQITFAGNRFENLKDAAKMACHAGLPKDTTRTAEWNVNIPEVDNEKNTMISRGIWKPSNITEAKPNKKFPVSISTPMLEINFKQLEGEKIKSTNLEDQINNNRWVKAYGLSKYKNKSKTSKKGKKGSIKKQPTKKKGSKKKK